jgi:ubiquinone/menaquinone biosynthesis C-methylase UbiE
MARKYAADPIADMGGYERTLTRVAALLQPSDSVLEIGCGTGTTALRLAGGVSRYLATDIASEMTAIANEKLAQTPVRGLQFATADAAHPPQGSTPYDAVLAFNTLHLVPGLSDTLQAVRRVLKPGGLLISKTACIREMNALIPWLAIPLMRAFGKAPDLLLFDALQLEEAIERNSFTIEAVERHGTRGKDFRVYIAARRAPMLADEEV